MKYQFMELVERAKQGDGKSVEEIVSRLKPLILKTVKVCLRDGLSWEDLYQEGCIIIIEAIDSYNPDRGVPFLAYVKARVSYGIYNMARRESRYNERQRDNVNDEGFDLLDMIKSPDGSSEEQYICMDETRNLYKALLSLPLRQREVIYLHYIKGMKMVDIAASMNLHYKGILKAKKRGIENLMRIYNTKKYKNMKDFKVKCRNQ